MRFTRILAAAMTIFLLCGCAERQSPPEAVMPAAPQTSLAEPPQNDASPMQEDTVKTELVSERFSLTAYLPVQSPTAQTAALERLNDLVLIGGVVWDAQGELLTGNDEIFTHLNSLENRPKELNLWVTINPSGRLIREGTAGQTIDTSEERERLARTLSAFAKEHGLYGIDIDWEFPANEQEWEAYSLFVPLLEQELEQAGVQLCLTFYPTQVGLSDNALQAADRIHIMAYDQFDEQGNHSSFETAQEAIRYFLKRGCRSEQLVLGIPLYGRPVDGSQRWDLYHTLPTVNDFSVNRYQDSCYNGVNLMISKAELARQQQLGGIMLYHLGCDVPTEQEASAVKNLSDWLKGKSQEEA